MPTNNIIKINKVFVYEKKNSEKKKDRRFNQKSMGDYTMMLKRKEINCMCT